MASYTISATVDYSGQNIAEVDEITFLPFAGPGALTATFDLTQFDHSEPFPQPDIIIRGASGTNNLVLLHGVGADVPFVNTIVNDFVFQNWSASDRITHYGSAFNEAMAGTNFNDRLYGGSGNDTLQGLDGNDTLYGGAGNDQVLLLTFSSDANVAYGGSGTDTVFLYGQFDASANIDMTTGSGSYRQQTFSGFEVISFDADDGNHTIQGGAGNDSLSASDGADVSYLGGGGDDRFDVNLDVTGTLDGGSGTDLFICQAYDSFGTAFSIDISDGGGGRDMGAGLTLAGFERLNVQTGTLADYLRGGALADSIDGDLGNDTIIGGAGADTLKGNGGTDTLSYQFSALAVSVNLLTGATALGEAAGDVISGFENLTGGLGNDTLIGNNAANTILGGNGNDSIAGASGSDVLSGGAGNDSLHGGTAGDTLTGGGGSDRFVYRLTSESAVVKSDLVTDFTQRLDKVDLSYIGTALGSDTFTFGFIGTNAFANGAVPQVRYEVGATSTTILAETTGDGIADMRIVLTGVYALTAGDFLL
ncbi:MAG: calcium-binding protein [Gemmobacter sp.]